MKILEQSVNLRCVPYANRSTRFLTYGSVGIVLVYISEPGSWSTLHTYDLFPLAILVSVSLSLLLGEYIHYLTVYLDQKAGWLRGMAKRWFLQLLLGFLLPLILAVSGMYVYYTVNGYSFAQSTYFDGVFYLIATLLLLVAVYYQMTFSNYVNKMVARDRNRQKDKEEAEQALVDARENARLLERANAQNILLQNAVLQIQDILLIYATNKFVLYCTSQNMDESWDFTIIDTIAVLPAQDFYRISKGIIVARTNIEAVYKFTDTTYEIQLYYPNKRTVTVSQRERKNFKDWYGLQIFPKRSPQSE